ncbi:MAG: hypothetical protein NVS2B7_13820 [Herpetosiphon sp.]
MTARTNEADMALRSQPIRRARQRRLLLVAALFMLPFVLFSGETLGKQAFFIHDIQYYFYPYHTLVAEFLRHGYLPLWNPYAFSGIPLLGDGQTAIFYPPNWLFLVLPATLALNYDVLLQFSLAGTGMFLYTRHLGVGRAAAALAGLAFMFNGFITTRVVHLSIMSGAALIPFVFYSVDRLRLRPSWGRFAVASLAVAIQAMAGHPQVPIYTALGVGVYLVAQEIASGRAKRIRNSARTLARVTGVYVVGYCLAAIQLAPWIDFARLSPRAAGASFSLVAGQSIIGIDWVSMLLPYLYGGARTSIFNPSPPFLPASIYIWERSGYVGILTLALAAFTLLGREHTASTPTEPRHKARWGLFAVLLVGIAVAGGRDTPIAQLVYVTPVLGKLRAYARAVILVAFSCSALAAIGLQQLIDATSERRLASWARHRLLIVATLLALAFMFVLGLLRVLVNAQEPAQRAFLEHTSIMKPNAWIPLAFALATIALLLWWSRFGVTDRPVPALLLLGLDMVIFAAFFNPTIPATDFAGTSASVDFLKRDHSLYRTATFLSEEKLAVPLARAQLAISWGLPVEIESINGFNSLQPRRYTDFLFGPSVGDVSYGFLGDNSLLQPGNNTLSMLQTKYVLVQPGTSVTPGADYRPVFQDNTVAIYQNLRVYPRAYFVQHVQTAMDPAVVLQTIKDRSFDPRTHAIIEETLRSDLVARLSGPTAESGAEVERLTPNHLRVTATTKTDHLLVISEMFMPGWYATIDGQATPIYRTNYLFRGIIVPPGRHIIELRYRPLSALVGVLMTFVTAFSMLVGGWLLRRRGRPMVDTAVLP